MAGPITIAVDVDDRTPAANQNAATALEAEPPKRQRAARR